MMSVASHSAALAIVALAVPASAHVGRAGGQTIHWDAYRFELVPGPSGSRILVYRASDRKPMAASAMLATARLLIGGKLLNARFQATAGNVLASPQARLLGDWTASISLKLAGASPTIRYSGRGLAALRRAGAQG